MPTRTVSVYFEQSGAFGESISNLVYVDYYSRNKIIRERIIAALHEEPATIDAWTVRSVPSQGIPIVTYTLRSCSFSEHGNATCFILEGNGKAMHVAVPDDGKEFLGALGKALEVL